MGHPLIAAMGPLGGGTGTWMLAREHLAHKTAEGFATEITMLGLPMLAGGVIAVAADIPALNQQLDSYQRRLDNIDGGLSF